MRSPICAMLLLEPPLRTAQLWSLAHPQNLERDPALMFAVFGATEAGIAEPRDYTPLLQARECPIDVLIGEARPAIGQTVMPSLVDRESRRQLAATPNVACTVVPGAGHHVARAAGKGFGDGVLRLAERLRAARTPSSSA